MYRVRSTELVQGFRHSVPYINAHRGKTFVVMLSGETLMNKNFVNILNDIGMLHSLGIRLVIVYGARPQIEANIKKQGDIPHYHKNIRITDSNTLEIVKQTAGMLQLDITSELSMSVNNTPLQGVHINVVSGNFVIAQPIGVDEGVDYQHSGKIRRIDTEAINHQLNNHAIVLIGPVAVSITGESFNLTAEEVATQIAIKLNAEKLIGFSNQQGISDEHGHVISEIFPDTAQKYLSLLSDEIESLKTQMDSFEELMHKENTLRFLNAAVAACKKGVRRSHLISFHEDGSLLQELFSRDGIGTQVVEQSAEQVRQATIHDIGGILELIRPLEDQGILVRRSREQLEIEIDKFTVVVRDNLSIACAALYGFEDEKMGEMACVAVHPEYRNSSRGDILLEHIKNKAKKLGLEKIFVLTTSSIHWFQERGFKPAEIDDLPFEKRKLYNYQRRSKILIFDLNIEI
ncbi:amino-acid N-acetyltransferase [Thorsellia kenyensis]|uniref:Amino-acid acetyltransferase n=1 Tax=Thorsellia kenyensis TaxID=1549888 RepID=A0ABV6C839_9GAMM